MESLFSWPFAAKLQSSAKQIKISGGKINPFPAQQGKLNLELISLSIHICIHIYIHIMCTAYTHLYVFLHLSQTFRIHKLSNQDFARTEAHFMHQTLVKARKITQIELSLRPFGEYSRLYIYIYYIYIYMYDIYIYICMI